MGNTTTRLFLASINGKTFKTYEKLHSAVHGLLAKSGDLFPRGYDAALLIDVESRAGRISWNDGVYKIILKRTLAMAV